MIAAAFWVEFFRWSVVAAVLSIPLFLAVMTFLIWRHTQRVEQQNAEANRQNTLKLELIRQQGEGLNWLVNDAKPKLDRVGEQVERKADETQELLTKSAEGIRQAIADTVKPAGENGP
jgi:hypothetical protein